MIWRWRSKPSSGNKFEKRVEVMTSRGSKFEFDDATSIKNGNSSKIGNGKEGEGGDRWVVDGIKLVEKNWASFKKMTSTETIYH